MAGYDGLDPAFAAKLRAMIAASGGRVTITSGFRSVERQKQLFDAAVKKYGSVAAARKWVAPPGKSRHNHGTAVDLGGDLKWVAANAARFGLYQPMEHEPWHYEPMGQRASKSAQTTPPDDGHAHGPGNPEALAELDKEKYGTMEAQLANLMAAIAAPVGDADQGWNAQMGGPF